MRILLTGTTGQVGGALLGSLQPIGVVLPVRRPDFDLSDPDSLPEKLNRIKPDLIMNPAAYTAVDRAEDDRELADLVNARAPGRIAAWAAEHAVPLIHFSTDYVFPGTSDRPWREDDRTDPLSVYGASKLAGETAIRFAKGPHLIVRTSWVYAARGTNFLRTIVRLARERQELRIVADQIGAPTSARVIADAIVAIVRQQAAALPELFARSGGLVHLACTGETSWHGFATAIIEGLKSHGVALKAERVVPIMTADYPTKARRPQNSRFDQTRLRQVFGLALPHWSDALAVELDEFVREGAEGPDPSRPDNGASPVKFA
jgi:dTDP-4-dehydrorhamnose reductase